MPNGLHLSFRKLGWIAALALLFAVCIETEASKAWANESHPAVGDCVIDRLRLIPKNGDPALLKFSEIRKKTEGALTKTEPTVSVIAKVGGAHGGEISVIKKTGAYWFSAYEAERFAPQGDPTWFPLIGGIKTGYFFGFRRISPNEMTIPDIKEISGAIQRINQTLQRNREETVGVAFYPAATNEVVFDEEFLRKFADERALPMAVEGPLAIHDVSYHLSAVFLPNQVIEHGARITKRLLEFVDFAKKQASGDRKLRWIVRDGALNSLLDQRAAQVDFLGNFTAIKASQITGELTSGEYIHEFGDRVHREFSAEGASPNQYLKSLVGSANTGIPRTPEEKLEEAQQFSELVQAFIQKYPDPVADQGLGLSHQDVIKQIDRKRGSVAKAVMSYGH